jgi:hypothetical protein
VSPLIGSTAVGEIKPLDVLELSETLIARSEISPKSVRNCLDDGTTVHVVGMHDLRSLKLTTGRPKDLDDIEKLDQIARVMLEEDDDGG